MKIIEKYKRLRSEAYLKETYEGAYAFVGMGQHSLSNLYPVIHYLQIPLKYICVTSEDKAALIGRKFRGVIGTTDLDAILADPEIKGVFVAASPKAHFAIAQKVLHSGKALFIEKPPCGSASELEELVKNGAKGIAVAGLQKRYAPAVRILKKKISGEKLLNYDLHYCTGAYPEGNALLDLYIHPIDLVCHLFGRAEVVACAKPSKDSYVLMLRHKDICGTLELSTGYSWDDAKQELRKWVNYALKNDALILYDAAYQAYIRDPEIPHSIYEIRGARKCAVEFHSFSKTAGFTGVRCGYTIVPKDVSVSTFEGERIPLNQLWLRRQCTKFNGTSYISQRAAEAIYTPEGKQQIQQTIDYYMDNAHRMLTKLRELGFEVYGGENAPYIWMRTSEGMGSWQFFEALLYGANVVCTPGVGFGPSGEGYVRFTAFGSREKTEEALTRIENWTKQH